MQDADTGNAIITNLLSLAPDKPQSFSLFTRVLLLPLQFLANLEDSVFAVLHIFFQPSF